MSVHTYYLITELQSRGLEVDFFLYSFSDSNQNPFITKLLQKLRQRGEVQEFKPTLFQKRLLKVNRVLRRVLPDSSVFEINPFLPAATRRFFSPDRYNYIISVNQSALCWVNSVAPNHLKKVFHYSLEVMKKTDPNIRKNLLYSMIRKEEKVLKKIRGLIIQDKERAEALINETVDQTHLEIIYLPVSVPGDAIDKKHEYFNQRLAIHPSKVIVLYFGSVEKERKIEELISAFRAVETDKFCLVIHGGRDMSSEVKGATNIEVSQELLDYDDLPMLISSASIGIAFYDNNWPNTRLTAFSSEKIARYLQAGVPFLALKNENYLRLQNEFHCCELIDSFAELEEKLEKILINYNYYRSNCFNAYNKYFKLENSIEPLVELLTSKQAQSELTRQS